MEGEIGSALETGQGDPEYWEAVLRRLQLHKAKAKLREVQAEMVRRHVAELEAGTNVRKEMGWDRWGTGGVPGPRGGVGWLRVTWGVGGYP